MSNDSEIQRLRKIIEEKDNQISKLTSEIKSLKMFVDGKVKLGWEHYKTSNVFVKCQICNDFVDCFQCHNKKNLNNMRLKLQTFVSVAIAIKYMIII